MISSVFKINIFLYLTLLFMSCSTGKKQVLRYKTNMCVDLHKVSIRLPSQETPPPNPNSLTINNLGIDRPTVTSCNLSSIQSALNGVNRNISRMKGGLSPDGTKVAAAIAKTNSCDSETLLCTPLPQPITQFNPYISKDITDPCVKYCVVVHEWEHFIDIRPWSLSMTDDELAIHWEMVPYEKENLCLNSYLKESINQNSLTF